MLQTLQKEKNRLADISEQLAIISNKGKRDFATFSEKLKVINLEPLLPTQIEILQINLGKMCNQVCSHCHVDAGPNRKEIMEKVTLQHCLDALQHTNIHTVDLTGGAPEMNPHFQWFVAELSKLTIKIIVRSNLSILNANEKYKKFPAFFKEHKVVVVSSLPCYTEANTDKQRGEGVFSRSIKALKTLNALGYGKANSDLELHLVYNPGGASLPGDQAALERDYKRELKSQFDIEFNRLYTITNLPISRFLHHLVATEKYDDYMETLINAFNPVAAENVMCRNTISVGWDGKLYDCDFNQMLELSIKKPASQHISSFNVEQLSKREIVVNRHCFGCTAGAGSSCQGSLA